MPLNKLWHDYNESLIERGSVLIDVSFFKSSNKEIKKMNIGKVGATFQYSDSYVTFLAFLKIGFKIPYRMVQGIVPGLSEYVGIVEERHFTHIRRRMLRIKPSIGNDNDNDNDNEEPIMLVVDASGLTVSKKGDYIEEKWIGKKKEFIKLHIAADAKSKKVVSFRSMFSDKFLDREVYEGLDSSSLPENKVKPNSLSESKRKGVFTTKDDLKSHRLMQQLSQEL